MPTSKFFAALSAAAFAAGCATAGAADPEAPEIETAQASGCIVSQTWNTQSADDYSMQFRIQTGPRSFEMFNFLVPNIKREDPSSFFLATRAESEKWFRVGETVERAAMSGRPVDVSYEVESRNVFGISVNWRQECAPA